MDNTNHEKTDDVGHVKDAPPSAKGHSESLIVDSSDLQPGYFRSTFFLGTFAALSVAILAGTASFGYAAPVLAIINVDLGPDSSLSWISYVYNTALAVTFPILGRMSDTFGRRYYFIGGAVLGVAGSAICATAQSISTLIGGNTLLGIASATQLSYHFVLGELVPTKYRYTAVAVLYTFTFAGSGFGPAIAYAVIQHFPSAGWRALYYILIGYEALALLLWTVFYFPPSFARKHGRGKIVPFVKHFDWVGTFLLVAGFTIFLFGISVGGNTYPWQSAPTLCMIILGFLTLVAFGLWEFLAMPQQAIAPRYIVANVPWTANAITVGFAASVYYTSAIVWPQVVFTLYDWNGLIQPALLASIPALANILGQVVGGPITVSIGHQRMQVITTFATAAVFTSACAVVNVHNKATLSALVFFANFFMGWVEIICLVNSTVILDNQQDIGVAGGLAAGIRSGISAISTVVYGTVLANRLAINIPAAIGPAVVRAGLPEADVPAFLEAFSAGTSAAFSKVPGITPTIIAAGTVAYKMASAHAYRTVYLVSIAFSALGLLSSFFTMDANKLVNSKVAATLKNATKPEQMGEHTV